MRCPNHHHVYQIENFLENKRRAKGTHTCTQEKTETVECRLSRLKYLKAQVTKPQIPSIRFSRTKYIHQICVMAFAGTFWCLCLQMNNFLSILMLFTHTHHTTITAGVVCCYQLIHKISKMNLHFHQRVNHNNCERRQTEHSLNEYTCMSAFEYLNGF